MIVDWHIVIRNDREIPYTITPHSNGNILQNYSIISQLGYWLWYISINKRILHVALL